MSRPTAWFGRKHIKNLWCLCLPWRKQAQYFIWGWPQGDLIPVPWKGWRDVHVLPTAPHGITRCWCCFAGELCSWTDEEPQITHRSATAPLWGSCMSHLIFNTHTSCIPCWGTKLWKWAPPLRGSTEPPLCCKNKRVKNLLHKGLKMGSGGGTEVSSHNILSRGVCQETKKALWKQFSFLRCWIDLNLLCSYCLSLDLRIIGYGTMKFCPNELCCADLQEGSALSSIVIRKENRSNNLAKWVSLWHTFKRCTVSERYYF